MPFLNSPIGEFQDPDGILESWAKYENLAFELMQKGELLPMDAPQCPAFHCPFGHKHIQLKPFEKRFLEGARKHEKKLISIQAKDKRFEYRAAATYVLAYLKNGKLVVESMVARIRDPDSLVRNNALRVLSHIAEFHHQLFIPIDPVIAALDYPKVSDRSKAVLILHGLASHSEDNKARIREKGAAFLLKLLASGQPGHREPAHSVLRAISGKNYPMANLQAWKQWANSLPKRGVSHKP